MVQLQYQLIIEDDKYTLRVVSDQTWGGSMQTVIHESAGTNGGIVITTGRNTNIVNLSGQILLSETNKKTFELLSRFGFNSNPLSFLNAIKNRFLKAKDKGIPVKLVAPIDNNDSGIYIITNFTGNVASGNANSLPFSMTLTEYKQANIQQTAVNLINLGPAEEFKKILELQQGAT